jgi:hypothetical protein
MCDTLIDSDHTSIQRRLKERESMTARVRSEKSLLERPLKPIAGLDADSLLEMTEASYIDLVQWTGEQPRADKRGKLRRQEQSTPPAAVWSLADAQINGCARFRAPKATTTASSGRPRR